MFDVAQLAGVSHQTVSRVINGSSAVRPEVLGRVQNAIRMLGYQRNTAARALATRRSMSLGVVSFGISQYGPSAALFGMADAARQIGYATSLVTLGEIDCASVSAALDHLIAISVDGIVVIAPVDGAVAAVHGLSSAVPLVTFEPGADTSPTSVATDEELGARLATRHLLELGHRSVWHVSGPPGWLGTDARIRGWRSELTAASRVAHEIVAGDWSAASGYRAGQQLARDPAITAIFVANDQMSLGLLQALHEAGVSVPRDISVVGFDDTPESAFFQPPLTTMRLEFAEVGRRCVARLLEMIEGAPPSPTQLAPPQLVVRSSAAAPRHAGMKLAAAPRRHRAFRMPATSDEQERP